MIFSALRDRCKNECEFVERQLELGLDAVAHMPGILPRFHPDVSIGEWKERPANERYPVLHRVYHTPAGDLTASVRQTEDWPYRDHVPLFDDFLAPRSTKFLVTEQADIEKFRYLMRPPSDEDIRQFRAQAREMKRFAEAKGVLLCGGRDRWAKLRHLPVYGAQYEVVGCDALMWICGGTAPLYWTHDQPEMLEELIDVIATWSRRLMELYLAEGIDLIIKRGWYESADFWSPRLYKRFISPVMKKDIELSHQAGVKFGYIMTTGTMPRLDDMIELKVDVNIGVDPLQRGGIDLKLLKEKSNSKLCLWGGVNGCHTIECGTQEEVEASVANAFRFLSNSSGFILSPVDNITEDTEQTWRNIRHLIDAWKRMRYVT